MTPPPATASSETPPRWGKVIDHESCIGCHACSTACKSENEVPLSVNRTYVKYVDVGVFPTVRRSFQVTRCNQCADAPCTHACPTRAMYAREDGIVDFDKSICIGCKACIAACPYDAIFINPEDHSAEKCNFCAHRIDVGLEPACVVVCPTEAIVIGDLNDPGSRVAQLAHRGPVAVRRPEKETRPKLFYRGAHQATLDPLAARRPGGGLFLWSEQTTSAHHVVSGYPVESTAESAGDGGVNSSAAAMLAYDVPHKAPWDWRVSLYTLTKGIAAGAYMVPLMLVLLGAIGADSPLWRWGGPLVAGIFLGITGLLLLSDLEHPGRFYLIFTRPQWRSWLVKGAFILAAYSAVLGLHLIGSFTGGEWVAGHLAWLGAPLAVLAAVYTAYLFAQAKARDLWQSSLLPPHLLVQGILAGSAALVPVASALESTAITPLMWTLATSGLVHFLMIVGEVYLTHGTAHAKLATFEMTAGRYKSFYGVGMGLTLAAIFGGIWFAVDAGAAAWVTSLLALTGLFLFEHAYVQAGQAVPLA